MTIRAATWNQCNDQMHLTLGEIVVARVMDNGGRNNRPRWIFHNTPSFACWTDARTVDAAKAAAEAALSDWLVRTGLVGPVCARRKLRDSIVRVEHSLHLNRSCSSALLEDMRLILNAAKPLAEPGA